MLHFRIMLHLLNEHIKNSILSVNGVILYFRWSEPLQKSEILFEDHTEMGTKAGAD